MLCTQVLSKDGLNGVESFKTTVCSPQPRFVGVGVCVVVHIVFYACMRLVCFLKVSKLQLSLLS